MDYLKDLEKIVNINSHTKNKAGVDKVGDIMSSWLQDLGFKSTVYTRKVIGNHFLFTTSHKKNVPKILLLGHNDTVFPKNYFEGFTQDDIWVYGPGVCDMKGGNIVALQALRNLYTQNGTIFNIDFLLVSDEETGSDDSFLLTARLAKNYDYCFVFEAAGKNMELVTARKGVGRYIVTIDGRASHAGTSYEKGINANLEGAKKLIEYSNLINLEKGTIVNVGKIDGGIGINTVSPHCEMLVEFRFDTKEEQLRVMQGIEKITNTSYVKGSKTHANGLIQRGVMEENQEQLNLVCVFEKLLGHAIKTQHRGGVSDANIVAAQGTLTLDGFGPYGDGDHSKHERALKSSFEQRIQMMTTILNYFQSHKF